MGFDAPFRVLSGEMENKTRGGLRQQVRESIGRISDVPRCRSGFGISALSSTLVFSFFVPLVSSTRYVYGVVGLDVSL